MWIRKTDEHMARERWFSAVAPVGWFVIIFLLVLFSGIFRPHWYTGLYRDESWTILLFKAVFSATLIAIGVYFFQVYFGRALTNPLLGPNVEICNQCHRTRNPNREKACECGGTFEDFTKWTWVDDGEEPSD
ncbi:MAG: hypothetical protein JW818_20670 [Pirellulales bacterium]|nr:hypothetical protein [Pirellulales bacterium]